MKTTLRFGNRVLYNPTKKVISSVLRKTPAYYEMSLYLMRTRIEPRMVRLLYNHGRYQTNSGGTLILRKNMVYLVHAGIIKSLRDLNRLENQMELSRQEVLIQYPIYLNNLKTIDMFNNMLGKAWKKN